MTKKAIWVVQCGHLFPNQRYWGWRDSIEVFKVGIPTLLSVEEFKT